VISKKLLFILTLLLVLGPVPNTGFGIIFDLIILTSLVLFLYFIITKKKYSVNKQILLIKKSVYIPFFYILFISIPITIISIEFSVSSLFVLARCIKIIITFYGCLALVSLYKAKYNTDYFNIICKHILYVILINSLVMFSQLFISEFKIFTETILYNNVSDIHFQSLLRVGGLYLSGGALASVFQGFGLLLLPLLYRENKINFIQTVCYFIILSLSIVITGRSGLLLIPISIILFIRYSSFKTKFTLISFFLIAYLFSSSFFLMIETLVFGENNDLLSFNYDRLMRLDSSSGGSDISGTLNIILNKFSISNNIKTLFFGDLNFSNLKYTNVSDMGWNINLYKFGLFGIVIYYVPFFVILFSLFKKKIGDKSKGFFVKIIILSTILFEFKEQFIYARNGFSILMMISISYLLIESNSHSVKKSV
jgi:hypothetical protein